MHVADHFCVTPWPSLVTAAAQYIAAKANKCLGAPHPLTPGKYYIQFFTRLSSSNPTSWCWQRGIMVAPRHYFCWRRPWSGKDDVGCLMSVLVLKGRAMTEKSVGERNLYNTTYIIASKDNRRDLLRDKLRRVPRSYFSCNFHCDFAL